MLTLPKHPPEPADVLHGRKMGRPWLMFFQSVIDQIVVVGTALIVGPTASTDNAIVRWDGATGKIIQNSGITISDVATGTLSGTNTGDQDTFKTIAVSGQTDVVADGPADTLTLAAGTGVTITTTPGTDTVTIAATGTGGTVTVSGSPVSGNLTKFSGASSITNGDLSGDVTTSGTLVTALAASGVAAGTYGDATHVGQFTVNAKGLITSAMDVAISGGSGSGADETYVIAMAVAF